MLFRSPVVELARAHGVPIIGDTELFISEIADAGAGTTLVAVTGTNGKSTTTALIGHLLARAGVPVQVGGNIGDHAVLELKPPVNQDTYVIEFSSYQLDLTPGLAPRVAVFLNLSPDHLERHGGFDNYARVKTRIFSGMRAGGTLVLGMDDPHTAAMRDRRPKGVGLMPISQDTGVAHGVYARGTEIFDATAGTPVLLASGVLAVAAGWHDHIAAPAALAQIHALFANGGVLGHLAQVAGLFQAGAAPQGLGLSVPYDPHVIPVHTRQSPTVPTKK